MRTVFFRLLLLAGLLISLDVLARQEPELVPIRIGWQTAWTVQGQIAQTLKHTAILERHGLRGVLTGFTYGGPLTEAALAGQVDVAFLGEQPAVNLIARDPSWQVVSRLLNTRLAVIVPKQSSVRQVRDLQDKTIAMPFGSTAQRLALGWLESAGLTPGRSVRVVNLDITEQSALVLAGTPQTWKNDVDALASWDPNVALFVDKGLARVLKEGTGLAVVVMSQRFIAAHPESPARFLRALLDAYWYYASHPGQANRWFSEEARLTLDPKILDEAASFEPNLKAKQLSDIDLTLSEQDIHSLQAGALFGMSQGLTSTVPDMAKSINLLYLERARKMPPAELVGPP